MLQLTRRSTAPGGEAGFGKPHTPHVHPWATDATAEPEAAAFGLVERCRVTLADDLRKPA